MNIILTSGTRQKLPISSRQAVLIQNNSGEPIFLGSGNVTADDEVTGGFILADGRDLGIANGGDSALLSTPIYAIQDSGSDKKLTILLL